MVFINLLLQVIDVVLPVTFRTADILMSGHVLRLTKVVVTKPINNDALTDLTGVFDLRTGLFQCPEQMKKAVL